MRSKIIFSAIVSGLVILSFSSLAYSKWKEIETTSPKYLVRKSKLWEKGGRLVGELKNPPTTFTIDVRRSGSSEAILTEEHKDFLSIYETAFLPAGKYTITIKAAKYQAYVIKNVEIKAATDCIINIKFGTIDYERG